MQIFQTRQFLFQTALCLFYLASCFLILLQHTAVITVQSLHILTFTQKITETSGSEQKLQIIVISPFIHVFNTYLHGSILLILNTYSFCQLILSPGDLCFFIRNILFQPLQLITNLFQIIIKTAQLSQ